MSTPPDNRTTGAERPLCLCVSREWGAPQDFVETVAETGWNGWFTVWRPEAVLSPAVKRCAAAGIAVQTVSEWLLMHTGQMDRVIFNVFKDEDREYYEQLF